MKVYLSHSQRDYEIAHRVAEMIRSAGHEALIDQDFINPDVNFKRAIEQMIDEADVVLVIWTPASVSSEWVSRQANLAIELNKYLGFRTGGVELPLQFLRIQHHDIGEHGAALDAAVIRRALAEFDTRSSGPRSTNRTVRQASKRQSDPPPPPRRSSAPPIAQQQTNQRVDEDVEIPAFLRRAEEPAASAPLPEPPAAAAPVVPDSFAPAAPEGPVASERYDVFISYSRKDIDACKLAFNLMVERGLVPWYDKDIGSGAFKKKIVTRISKASVFVLLVSKNSVGSPNVSKELSVASSSDRLIIPIAIDGTKPEDLNDTFKYELIELNIFNADPKVPDSWSDVIKTIAQSVSEVRAEAASPAGVQPLTGEVRGRLRRPWLFAGVTVLSGILQQGAVGYSLWASGFAAPELAGALAVAAGVVVWPMAYGAAYLARQAFRSTPAG